MEWLKTILKAIRQKEFTVLLFIVFAFLFIYPLLMPLKNMPLSFPFRYFFSLWAALVVLLFISNYKADSD